MFESEARKQAYVAEQLKRSKKSDLYRASEWRKEYLRKTLSKDLQARMSSELASSSRLSPLRRSLAMDLNQNSSLEISGATLGPAGNQH